jgi:hypothetical protein
MRHKLTALWLAILAIFAWNSLDTAKAFAADQKTKPNIEHMKVIRKGVASIQYEETWFNPTTGDARLDYVSYNFGSTESVNATRSLLVENGKRKYQLKTVNGEWTGETWLNRVPVKYYQPYHSLFQYVEQRYKMQGWQPIAVVDFNGKKVQKVQFIEVMPNITTTTVAYLDLVTGLPVKEELYNNNADQPFLVNIYLFDRINDPAGAIFKDFSGATIKEVVRPSF